MYLPSWFQPRKEDWVKVTYLLSQKPVSKVIGNVIHSVAICGERQSDGNAENGNGIYISECPIQKL